MACFADFITICPPVIVGTNCGFTVNRFENFEFDLNAPNPNDPDNPLAMKEKYYCVVATKTRPLDIK